MAAAEPIRPVPHQSRLVSYRAVFPRMGGLQLHSEVTGSGGWLMTLSGRAGTGLHTRYFISSDDSHVVLRGHIGTYCHLLLH